MSRLPYTKGNRHASSEDHWPNSKERVAERRGQPAKWANEAGPNPLLLMGLDRS